MSKSLRKDFRREIRKSFSRFISIMLIVVLGVAFYSGIRSSMPAMRLSADALYDKENLMDIRVVGTLGLTDNDIKALREIEGVEEVEGSYSTDFLCLSNSKEIVTKAIAMPESISNIKVISGRFPEKYDECVVSREFLEQSGLSVGDYMTLTSGTGESVFDTLASETYLIVGICSSSYFLNGDMGTSSIGDGMVDGYVVIPREAFVSSVYTTAYLTVSGAKDMNSFDEEYKDIVGNTVDKIEAIAEKRCDIRYSEVRSQSNELFEKARNTYITSKTAAENELAEAYQELLNGQETIEQNKIMLEQQKEFIEMAVSSLPEAEEQIAAAEKQIADGEKQIADFKATRDTYYVQLQDAQAKIEELKNNPEADANSIAVAESTAQFVKRLYDEIDLRISNNEKTITAAKAQLEEKKQTIEQIRSAATTGPAAIADAEAKIAAAEAELSDGEEKYNIAKQDADAELADAEEELARAEREINEMEKPVWYVLDRNSIESYLSYTNDAQSIGAIGTVFPIIFFLVAALVSLTTMTRMVEEQRTQIGTYKALGYSKASIMSKYVLYAFLASVIGSVIGVFLGEYTIPDIIVRAYKMVYYNLGSSVVEFNVLYGVSAGVFATLCTTAAAFAACVRELRSVPAQLMRPASPKFGKRILLERINFIWDRLNFGQKAAFRNLFRYKKRFFMTLFGVGGCMALLLVGLGIRDSVAAMADNQYGRILTYDGVVSVDASLTRAQRRTMLSELSDISDVTSYLQANRTMIYSTHSADDDIDSAKNAYLIVPRNTDDLAQYVSLRERGKIQNELTLSNEGVIITEKYAEMLNVGVGDSIFLRTSQSDAYPKEVKIGGITENYIFNYVYMTPTLYQSVYSQAPELNMLMIKTADGADASAVSEQLLKINGINSVTMNSESLATLNEIVNRLYFVIIIMIVAAGVLAFVVLYNLNNINISERRRELATIKLLGFYNGELSMYVYRENFILTLLGTVLGIFLGILLHRFVMTTVETDMYTFGRTLNWTSILIGALLTIIFAMIVNFVMYFKLKKIDMVESLKSVE